LASGFNKESEEEEERYKGRKEDRRIGRKKRGAKGRMDWRKNNRRLRKEFGD